MAVATALAIAAALASAGVTAYQGAKVAHKQDQIAADGIRKQGANQAQANARINQTVSDTANSRSEPARATAQQQYLETLVKHMGQAKAGLATKGLGDQFNELAGGAGSDISSYGNNIADLFARMDAPIAQRREEGHRAGDLGMDLSVLEGNVHGDDFLNRLRQSQVRPNPWLSILAGGLKGVASAGGGGATGWGSYDGMGSMT